jgi:2-O-A-mannosyl-D-glycerate-specific PTS system IIC component
MSALSAEEPQKQDDAPERSFLIPVVLGSIATAAFLQAGLSWVCGELNEQRLAHTVLSACFC